MRQQHRHNHGNHHHQQNQKRRQKISDHFSRKDFFCKSGLDDNSSFRISAGLIGALELLRYRANQRINIMKGYECSESAERTGKVKRNYHNQGLAANVTIDNTPLEIAFLIAEEIPDFTGICLNLDEKYIHLRVNKGKNRELWVRKNSQDIPLTDENHAQYFAHVIPADPEQV